MSKRLLIVAGIACLLIPAVADARRAPTKSEKAAIATAMDRPAKCQRVFISTVNHSYASWQFRDAKGCARYGSNGLDILKRINGQWKDLGGSSDGTPVRGVPSAVYKDLCACRPR